MTKLIKSNSAAKRISREKLLVDPFIILVSPALIRLTSWSEALFLQQLHYWLGRATHEDEDGQPWIYKKMEEWCDELCKDKRTISSARKRLRDRGILREGEFNKMVTDRTLWYTIDYRVLDNLPS